MDGNHNEEKEEQFVREEGTIDVFGMLALFGGIVGLLFVFSITDGFAAGLVISLLAILSAYVSIRRIGKTKIAGAGRILGIIGAACAVLFIILRFTL